MFGVDDAALASLIAAGVTTAGALYTNKSNISATQAANNQNLSIAAMNNATQIDMANSAHQREVADLRAAGLNPLLSAGGSGSSTPTLQSATMQASHYENPVQHAVQSAGQLGRYISESYQLGNLKTAAETSNLSAQNANLAEQNKLLQAQTRKTIAEANAVEHPATRWVDDVYNKGKKIGDGVKDWLEDNGILDKTGRALNAIRDRLNSNVSPGAPHSAGSTRRWIDVYRDDLFRVYHDGKHAF